MQGYLLKKEDVGFKGFRSWKKYYFVLTYETLSWYKKPEDAKKAPEPFNVIQLTKVIKAQHLPDKRLGARFDVTIRGGMGMQTSLVSLDATDVKFAKKWSRRIFKASEKARQRKAKLDQEFKEDNQIHKKIEEIGNEEDQIEGEFPPHYEEETYEPLDCGVDLENTFGSEENDDNVPPQYQTEEEKTPKFSQLLPQEKPHHSRQKSNPQDLKNRRREMIDQMLKEVVDVDSNAPPVPIPCQQPPNRKRMVYPPSMELPPLPPQDSPDFSSKPPKIPAVPDSPTSESNPLPSLPDNEGRNKAPSIPSERNSLFFTPPSLSSPPCPPSPPSPSSPLTPPSSNVDHLEDMAPPLPESPPMTVPTKSSSSRKGSNKPKKPPRKKSSKFVDRTNSLIMTEAKYQLPEWNRAHTQPCSSSNVSYKSSMVKFSEVKQSESKLLSKREPNSKSGMSLDQRLSAIMAIIENPEADFDQYSIDQDFSSLLLPAIPPGTELSNIFEALDISKYLPAFKTEEYVFEDLLDLDKATFESLIPPAGPRNRLLQYIASSKSKANQALSASDKISIRIRLQDLVTQHAKLRAEMKQLSTMLT